MNAKIYLSKNECFSSKWEELVQYAMNFQAKRPIDMSIHIASDNLNTHMEIELIYHAGDSIHVNYISYRIKMLSNFWPGTKLQITRNLGKVLTMNYIKKNVCNFFNVPEEMLDSATRKREIVTARQLCHFFAKNRTKESLATIGLNIGNKDHATVLHSCRTVINLIETDRKFAAQVKELEDRIK